MKAESVANEGDRKFNDEQIKYLKGFGYTNGLIHELNEYRQTAQKRYWLVSNSTCMRLNDSAILAVRDCYYKFFCFESRHYDYAFPIRCSRWSEIKDCVLFHTELSTHLELPTMIRFLNQPDEEENDHLECTIDHNDNDLHNVVKLFDTMPFGSTPIAKSLEYIRREIEILEPELVQNNRKVVVLIAIDDTPTDEAGFGGKNRIKDFLKLFREINKLPVNFVFRLSCRKKSVVSFYTQLDCEFGKDVEILNSFIDEANIVYKYNPWINYTLPFHTLRELGLAFHNEVVNLIDEKELECPEMVQFCSLILGPDVIQNAPVPTSDWNGFLSFIKSAVSKERLKWNPVLEKSMPLIDIEKIDSIYRNNKRFPRKTSII